MGGCQGVGAGIKSGLSVFASKESSPTGPPRSAGLTWTCSWMSPELEKGLIERRGSRKTGGYYALDGKKSSKNGKKRYYGTIKQEKKLNKKRVKGKKAQAAKWSLCLLMDGQ